MHLIYSLDYLIACLNFEWHSLFQNTFFLLHRRAEVWTDRCIFPCSNLIESDCDPSSRSYAATGIYQCNNNATLLWWTGILPWCWHDGWRISSLHNSHVPGMLLQKLLCCIQVHNLCLVSVLFYQGCYPFREMNICLKPARSSCLTDSHASPLGKPLSSQ